MTTHFMAHRLHHLELVRDINEVEVYCRDCDLFIDNDSIDQAQPRYRLVVTPVDRGVALATQPTAQTTDRPIDSQESVRS